MLVVSTVLPLLKKAISLMELWINSNSCTSFRFTSNLVYYKHDWWRNRIKRMIGMRTDEARFKQVAMVSVGCYDVNCRKQKLHGKCWISKIHSRFSVCDYSKQMSTCGLTLMINNHEYNEKLIETNVNKFIWLKNYVLSIAPQFMNSNAFPGSRMIIHAVSRFFFSKESGDKIRHIFLSIYINAIYKCRIHLLLELFAVVFY